MQVVMENTLLRSTYKYLSSLKPYSYTAHLLQKNLFQITRFIAKLTVNLYAHLIPLKPLRLPQRYLIRDQ